MISPDLPLTPGTCFRFTVANAEQAAQVIREKLGDRAQVLSVRNVASKGFGGLFSSPKLEVIAQIAGEAPVSQSVAIDCRAGSPDPAANALASSNDGGVGGPRPTTFAPRTRRLFEDKSAGAQRDLGSLLRRSGFSEMLVGRLQSTAAWNELAALPLHRALVETGRQLTEISRARPVAPLHRAAFLGSAGSGRTTALCKWLATEVFRRARVGHVVTAEFDRPNSSGPLPVFCTALGVPLAHYPAVTTPATPNGFVYVDLPGISIRQPSANAAIERFLAEEKINERVLVLNAAYAHPVLRDSYAAGRDLGATHVVFTHLDEVTHWGRLWDYLLEGELAPLFLSTGPSLTGDLELDAADALARRTLPAAEDLSAASVAAEVVETSATEPFATTDAEAGDASAPSRPALLNTAA